MAQETVILSFKSRGTRKVRGEIKGVGRESRKAAGALALMRAGLVVFASASVLKGFASVADGMTTVNNRLTLVTNSTVQLNAVTKELFRVSQELGTPLAANVDLFARLQRSTRGLGLSMTNLVDLTRTIGQAAIVSGTEAKQFTSAVVQLGQGLATGAISGDELRSVVEGFPRLAEAIGKEFGKTGGELINFGKANPGLLSTERVLKGLAASAAEINKEYEATTVTIDRSLTRIGNSFTVFIGNVIKANDTSSRLTKAFDVLAKNIGVVFGALAALAGGITFLFLLSQLAALPTTIALVVKSFLLLGVTMARAVFVPVTLVANAYTGLVVSIARVGASVILLDARIAASRAGLLAQAAATRIAAAASVVFSTALKAPSVALKGVIVLLKASRAAFVATRGLYTTTAIAVRGYAAALVSANAATKIYIATTQGLIRLLALARAGFIAARVSVIAYSSALKSAAVAQLVFGGGAKGIFRVGKAFKSVFVGLRGLRASSGVFSTILKSGFGLFPLLKGLASGFKFITAAILRMGAAFLLNPLFVGGLAIVAALSIGFVALGGTMKDVGGAMDKVGSLFSRVFTAIFNSLLVFKNNFKQIPGFMKAAAASGMLVFLGIFERGLNKVGDFFAKFKVRIGKVEFTEFRQGLNDIIVSNGGDAIKVLQEYNSQVEKTEQAGGALKRTGAKVRELTEQFRSLGKVGSLTAEEIRSLLEGTEKSAKKASKATQSSLAAIGNSFLSLASSVNPYIDAQVQLAQATSTLSQLQKNQNTVLQATLKDLPGITRQQKEFLTSQLAIGSSSRGQADIMKRLTRELVGVGNAAFEAGEKQRLLDEAYKDTTISAREFSRAADQLRLDQLENAVGVVENLEKAFLGISLGAETFADTITGVFDAAFSGLSEQIKTLAKEGTFSVKEILSSVGDSLIDSGINQLKQIAASALASRFGVKRTGTPVEVVNAEEINGGAAAAANGQAIGGLGKQFEGTRQSLEKGFGGLLKGISGLGSKLVGSLKGIFSGSGGVLSSLVSGAGSVLTSVGQAFGGLLPGFATGGSFDVGSDTSLASLSGTDNRLIAFRARDGENVSVRTPQQQTEDGQRQAQVMQGNVTLVQNITTPDIGGFSRSQEQVRARAQVALMRANRRDG